MLESFKIQVRASTFELNLMDVLWKSFKFYFGVFHFLRFISKGWAHLWLQVRASSSSFELKLVEHLLQSFQFYFCIANRR